MRLGTPELKSTAAAASATAPAVGRFRWRICGLLFFVTTLIYLDRQVPGVLAPELLSLIHISEPTRPY